MSGERDAEAVWVVYTLDYPEGHEDGPRCVIEALGEVRIDSPDLTWSSVGMLLLLPFVGSPLSGVFYSG